MEIAVEAAMMQRTALVVTSIAHPNPALRELAEGAGLQFVRTEMPNVAEAFIGVLADVVRRHLAGEPAAP